MTDAERIDATVPPPRANLPTGQVWLDDEGIIHSTVTVNSEVDLKEAIERVRLMGIAGRGKRRPVLVDIGRVRGMTRKARLYFSGPECNRVSSASALIVASPLGKAIGNFFIGLNRSVIPTKLFSDEATALTWLRTLL